MCFLFGSKISFKVIQLNVINYYQNNFSLVINSNIGDYTTKLLFLVLTWYHASIFVGVITSKC